MRWNDALTRSGICGPTLRKNPIFALTAVLTIVLGVGASTTIFSVTNAVPLRPLPLKDPHRLVIACSDMRKRNVRDFPFSNADFIDLREGTKNVFQGLAGVFTDRDILPMQDGTPSKSATQWSQRTSFAWWALESCSAVISMTLTERHRNPPRRAAPKPARQLRACLIW